MKLLIPVDDKEGKESTLSAHFGHCPGFYSYDDDKKSLEFIENNFSHSDPNKTFVDQIMDFKPNAVFSLGMGQKAIDVFCNHSVSLLTGDYKKVSEVIDHIKDLKPLDKNCGH